MPGREMGRIFRLVEALMVLHNILLDLGDKPEMLEDFDPSDSNSELLQELLNAHGRTLTTGEGNIVLQDGDRESIATMRAGGQALREGIMESLGI